jgi:hypothetical protein
LVGTLTLICTAPDIGGAVEVTPGVRVIDWVESGIAVTVAVTVDVMDGVSSVGTAVMVNVGVGDSSRIAGGTGLVVDV